MKKIFLSLVSLCAITVSAQTEIIIGDMNGDGSLSIGDVSVLTEVILKDKEPSKHSCKATAYISDNGELVGTWGDGTRSYTFNEDGTSSHGLYVFKPQLGRILFYDNEHQLKDFLLVHELTSTKLEMSTRDGKILNYTRGQVEDYYHEYVDLGLPSGTLWATCNLGADSPYDVGEYFAWGEVNGSLHGKSIFDWGQYEYITCTKTGYDFEYHKYYSSDKLSQLEPEDNAAIYFWGNDWDMPTLAQVEELINTKNVKCEKTTVDGKEVVKITSKTNGNYLCLPLSGYYDGHESPVYYNNFYGSWTKDVYKNDYSMAYALQYGQTNQTYRRNRCLGFPIRPVYVGDR